jgi:hypothetical protein
VDHHVTVPTSYFDRLYDQSDDPWRLATRWYETRKYRLTVASLPRERYRRGFEPGCSVGVLTELLADRCDALVATDAVMAAVVTARERLAHQPNVDVGQLRVPDEWPAGSFDLIVISEVCYYLTPHELVELVRRAAGALEPDGAVVVVHWRHRIDDFPLTGDVIHAVFKADARLVPTSHHEERDFFIDVFTAAGGRVS